jgi:hypothetical protein
MMMGLYTYDEDDDDDDSDDDIDSNDDDDSDYDDDDDSDHSQLIHTAGNDLYYEMIEGGVIKVDKATGKNRFLCT